jgi:hypothetical protein
MCIGRGKKKLSDNEKLRIFAPESICGLFIDQRSKVLPVIVIPCVCFVTPQSV